MSIKIIEGDEPESNIILLENFKNLSDDYIYRKKIVEELESRHYPRLSQEEINVLSYNRGYCYGYIDGIQKSMKQIRDSVKEAQIGALIEMKNCLIKELDFMVQCLERK